MTGSLCDPGVRGPRLRELGYWRDIGIDQCFIEAVRRVPDKAALIGSRADREQDEVLSYRQLEDRVARAAGGLRALGVGPGDIVAVQLPNWNEFVISMLAITRLGAVVNPLMPIFRQRELSFMLDHAEAKVLIVPRQFRGFDHAAMGRELQRDLPSLAHVVVVDGEGSDSFEALLQRGSPVQTAPTDAPVLDPDAMAVLMFTSGTTGSPKGVMHTSNTLLACTQAMGRRFDLGEDEVMLACSPVGHMIGFLAAVIIGFDYRGTVVMQDVWDPVRGVELLVRERVTYVAGSTPFLADICDVVAASGTRPQQLRNFLCGGAAIPPALIERAQHELQIAVCSLWGMSESLADTLTEPARALEKSSKTDGRALDGVEVRVVDDHGNVLAPGMTGNLQVRGAHNFIGYFKRPDISRGDADGWFDSGDLAYMDEEGYIRITGRTKDMLIRGGENVPVVEIENLLYRHPAVVQVAVVGFPDERLGERACAVVVLHSGHSLDLAEVQAHMEKNKVARQYWPERVEIVEQMPSTPTGKVQKFKLKTMLLERIGTELA